MKVYNSGGFKEFNLEDFLEHSAREGLRVGYGKLKSLKILERKNFTNEGNALVGDVIAEDGASFVMNIGGDNIRTSYRYYIPFLEESNCKKVGDLYVLNSIVRTTITYIFKGDDIRGYLSKKGLSELSKPSEI